MFMCPPRGVRFLVRGVRARANPGVSQNGSAASLFWGLPVGAAVLSAPVKRLAFGLGMEAIVSLRRPQFHVRGLDTLFRAGPAGLRLIGGVEVRFP